MLCHSSLRDLRNLRDEWLLSLHCTSLIYDEESLRGIEKLVNLSILCHCKLIKKREQQIPNISADEK